MNEESGLLVDAFQAGATGYLLKHSAPKELLQAIEEVLKGASYLSPRITSGAVAAMLRSGVVKPREACEVTPRQREVIQLLAEGRSMKEIADVLTISLRTVAAHKYRVMEMLAITTNADLYSYAVKNRIVSVQTPQKFLPQPSFFPRAMLAQNIRLFTRPPRSRWCLYVHAGSELACEKQGAYSDTGRRRPLRSSGDSRPNAGS